MKIDDFFPDQNRHVRFLLGLYFNRKRRELGLSIQDLAPRMELSSQSYKRIEAGRTKINPTVFDKIQSVLPIEVDDLNEIRKIAGVTYINNLSKVLVPNYPA